MATPRLSPCVHPMFVDHLLPPLLRAVPDSGAESEAAFDSYSATLTRQLAMLASALMVFFTVAWWPLDRIVLPTAESREAFGALRLRALGIEVFALAVFGLARLGPRATTAAATGLYAALMGAFGYSLGELGGADFGWLADAYLGVVPAAFVPMPLRWRIPATFAICGALAFGYFGAFPENLRHTGAWGQVSFLGFALLFSIAIGELWTRVMRRSFFEKQSLDVANAKLANLTDSLGVQVAERTTELRDLARHLDHVQESERARLARELHDELGQHLTAMRYTVARMGERAASDPAMLGAAIEDLDALLDGTTQAVRTVVASLRPRVVSELGIVESVRWLAEQLSASGEVTCTLLVAPDVAAIADQLDDATTLVLFRALQEGSTNARKHAHPSTIAMTLAIEAEEIVAEVRDDGTGFDVETRSTGFGLLGLRERLGDAGGGLTITSSPTSGTTLRAKLPVPRLTAGAHTDAETIDPTEAK